MTEIVDVQVPTLDAGTPVGVTEGADVTVSVSSGGDAVIVEIDVRKPVEKVV